MPPPAPPPEPPPQPGPGGRAATPQEFIRSVAKQYGVNPYLALAVWETESSAQMVPIRSPAGAVGPFQLMPETAKRHGVNRDDPYENVIGGIKELAQLKAAYGGDVAMMLRRYNGSPNASKEATDPYVTAVMNRYRRHIGLPPAREGEDLGTIIDVRAVRPGAPTGRAAGAGPVTGRTPTTGGGGRAPATGEAPLQNTRTGQPLVSNLVQSGKEALSDWDPREDYARANYAGLAASLAAQRLVPGSGPVVKALVGIGGAGLGGGAEQALEETGVFGNYGPPPPPPDTTVAGRIGEEALRQGGYQALGEGVAAGLKGGAIRGTQNLVSKYAGQYYSRLRNEALEKLYTTLDRLRSASAISNVGWAQTGRAVSEANRQAMIPVAAEAKAARQVARDVGQEEIAATRARGAEDVATTQQVAARGVTQAEQENAAIQTAEADRYNAAIGQPPPEAPAGLAVANVYGRPGGPPDTGWAQTSLDNLGQAVDAAADTGPMRDTSRVHAEAERIVRNELLPPESSFPHQAPATPAAPTPQPTGVLDASGQPILSTPPPAPPPSSLAQWAQSVQAAEVAGQLQDPLAHMLARILNSPRMVPFRDIHLWKKQLQSVLDYSAVVKTRGKAMTEHVANELRGLLSGHAPYDAATAAYAEAAPLFREGYAPIIREEARTNPARIVQMITQDNPTGARMIVDVLTTHAAAGGGAAEGRAALGGLQRAWLHRNVLDGGLAQLPERLAALRPEFREAFLATPEMTEVMQNLEALSMMQQQLVEEAAQRTASAAAHGGREVATAEQLRDQAVADARRTARGGYRAVDTEQSDKVLAQRDANVQAKEATTRAAEKAKLLSGQEIADTQTALRHRRAGTPEELAFAESTLSGLRPSAQVLSDVANAWHGGLSNYFSRIGLARLMMGASEKDMLAHLVGQPRALEGFVRFMLWKHWGTVAAVGTRTSGVFDPAEGPPMPPKPFPDAGPYAVSGIDERTP